MGTAYSLRRSTKVSNKYQELIKLYIYIKGKHAIYNLTGYKKQRDALYFVGLFTI